MPPTAPNRGMELTDEAIQRAREYLTRANLINREGNSVPNEARPITMPITLRPDIEVITAEYHQLKDKVTAASVELLAKRYPIPVCHYCKHTRNMVSSRYRLFPGHFITGYFCEHCGNKGYSDAANYDVTTFSNLYYDLQECLKQIEYQEALQEVYLEDGQVQACPQGHAYYSLYSDHTYYRCWNYNCQSRTRNRTEMHRHVLNYSYKPPLTFYGEARDGLYYGLEIEVETQNDPDRVAGLLHDASNKLVYCKSDSSIEQGVEIVTYPMSYDYFMENVPDTFWDTLRDEGQNYRTNYFETYDPEEEEYVEESEIVYELGVHIHMSRAAFHRPYHLFKFFKFVYDNPRFVQYIAGREGSFANGHENCSYKITDMGSVYLFDKKTGQERVSYSHALWQHAEGKPVGGSRYVAVNPQNPATIELRVFKSTVNRRRITAYVQFADALFYYTRWARIKPANLPHRIMSVEGFKKFIEAQGKYTELEALLRGDSALDAY
jgi:hypothetical protein